MAEKAVERAKRSFAAFVGRGEGAASPGTPVSAGEYPRAHPAAAAAAAGPVDPLPPSAPLKRRKRAGHGSASPPVGGHPDRAHPQAGGAVPSVAASAFRALFAARDPFYHLKYPQRLEEQAQARASAAPSPSPLLPSSSAPSTPSPPAILAFAPSPTSPVDDGSSVFRLSPELYNLVRDRGREKGETDQVSFHPVDCPHTRARMAPETEHSFHSVRDAYLCVESLFVQHHPGPWRPPRVFVPPTPQHIHLCNVHTCPMINHREIYICLVSGNMHHCGSTCPYGSEHSFNLPVCPITDRPFTAETTQVFTSTYEDGERSADQLRMTRVPAAPTRAALLRANRRMRTRQTLEEAAPVEVAVCVTKSEQDRLLYAQDTVKIMRRFLNPSSSLHKDDERLLVLAHSINQMERQLYQSSTPAQHYTREFHVFLMLHCMAHNGERHANRVYLSAEADVRSAMLPFDDALRLAAKGKQTGFVTKQLKFFRDAMSKFYSTQPQDTQ